MPLRVLIALLLLPPFAQAQEITRLWLSPAASSPKHWTICWETAEPGDSSVQFGLTPELGATVSAQENVTLHRVEIPAPSTPEGWFYKVRSGTQTSNILQMRGAPEEELRVVVMGDAGYARADSNWGDAILAANPHLLVSAGDNVASLHSGTKVAPENTTAFSKLIDRFPALFRSTPFLPALGNHDREIRPRGPKPPDEPVYDVAATAYREFFVLPGAEWWWHYDWPDFGVRFIALDLNHVQDHGTTWQTCHAYGADSEALKGYRETMAAATQPHVVTIYNERNATVRGLAGGEWRKVIERGSMAVTGFGYFAERADVEGFPYFNVCLKGDGDKYPDPKSAVLKSEDNFLLLTFPRGGGAFTARLMNLSGEELDRIEIAPRLAKP